MPYINGFILAVPTAKKADFIKHAETSNSVFMDLGAQRILECWEDEIEDGKVTDFRKAVQAKADESVVFSWMEWPDKATHDAAMEQMPELMKTEPRMNPETNPMPFDGMRMVFGGFEPVVVLEK